MWLCHNEMTQLLLINTTNVNIETIFLGYSSKYLMLVECT